ncbi:UV excision repair protein rad23 [Malassezia psittaci]|uniref:UV excision repair protein RAD23 n=1 Tax=Malassezia psittaci TaxID=1821823 RepID=A0AAF0JF80_9BASI|nr:UV excision repair protein rad23 [Malassezia psittaci]
MKLLVKSLAGGNFHLDVEPSDTVCTLELIKIQSVKEQVEKQQGHATEQQKLIFSGKILENSKCIQDYGIQEKDFLVVMVSKPKTAKPAPKPAEVSSESKESSSSSQPKTDESKQETSTTSSETKQAESSQTAAPSESAARTETSASTGSGQSTGIQAASFLSGSELESAIQNIVEMGFPREEVQRAMRLGFNNPDRAVDLLMTGLPAETTPAPSSTPSAGTGTAPSGTNNETQAPTTNAPRSGNLFEQAAAQAARGSAGGAGLSGASAGSGAEMLPGEDDGEGRQLIDLGNPEVLDQLRTLVEQNPAALQPLIQALVQTNPQLAEALSADPEGVLRMLSGGEGMEGMEAEESFEVPTLQQLSQEDKSQVEQIMAMGIPERKAIESFFMCGRNLEMAVQYYFEVS